MMEHVKTELFETGLNSMEVTRRYKKSVRDMRRNEISAAFYLAEVEKRRLWHEQGYSSVIHFAVETGGITEGKAYGLLRTGKGLLKHPVLGAAAVEGRIPWTKARELFRLKEALSEEELLEKATSLSNRELEDFVTDSNKKYMAKQMQLRAGIEKAVSDAVSAGTIGGFPAAGDISGVSAMVAQEQTGDMFLESATLVASESWDSRAIDSPVKGSRHEPEPPMELVTVTLKLTPEEFAIHKEVRRVWKRLNKGEWKRERMFTTLSKLYLEETAMAACRKQDELQVEKAAEGAEVAAADDKAQPVPPVMLESPYSIFIMHDPENGRTTMPGKRGDMLEVDKALFEQAMCDGAVYEVDETGAPGRKKRSVSPALRKKIFMRDKGVCSAPGCGSDSFLEIHHVKPLSKGGSNHPSNMTLICHRCHRHIHEGRLNLEGVYPDLDFRHVVNDLALIN